MMDGFQKGLSCLSTCVTNSTQICQRSGEDPGLRPSEGIDPTIRSLTLVLLHGAYIFLLFLVYPKPPLRHQLKLQDFKSAGVRRASPLIESTSAKFAENTSICQILSVDVDSVSIDSVPGESFAGMHDADNTDRHFCKSSYFPFPAKSNTQRKGKVVGLSSSCMINDNKVQTLNSPKGHFEKEHCSFTQRKHF